LYVAVAAKAANFIVTQVSRPDGRLLHTWRHGQAKLDAYLDDYAYLVNAFVTLYEAAFNERCIDEAVRLADLMRQHFEDKQSGGFFYTADDHEQLIARNKDFHDASVPSGNGMAATALLRLGHLIGNSEYLESARGAILAGMPIMERSPTAAGQLLIALDMWLGPVEEWVIIGGRDASVNAELLAEIQRAYLPNCVIAYRADEATQGAHAPRSPADGPLSPAVVHRSPHLEPLFAGRSSADGQPALFICQNFTCRAPLVGRESILAALSRTAQPR
jgi:uncharacterized protein YyaL (SSP411 family)